MAGVLTYRELALRSAQRFIGVHEVGFNNRGPWVDRFQREGAAYVGWVGFAWCAAFVFYNFKEAGYPVQTIPSRASVGFAERWARTKKLLKTTPMRGDIVNYQWDADSWPDHTGHVERVLKTGPVMYLQTVEGNTSPGDGGSQADGGGVYRRRRLVSANKVTFARITGKPDRNPDWFLSALTGKEAWVEWRLGVGRWVGWGKQNGKVRPDVPTKVPAGWWTALQKRTKEAK